MPSGATKQPRSAKKQPDPQVMTEAPAVSQDSTIYDPSTGAPTGDVNSVPTEAAPVDQQWLDALDGASSELQAQGAQNAQATRAASLAEMQTNTPSFLKGDGPIMQGIESAATGTWKAMFETKDAIFGAPNYADQSTFRKQVYADSANLANLSVANSLTGGIAQFATGLIGAGKLTAPLKAGAKIEEGGRLVKGLWEMGKAALVGATVFDPHQERLSNLVQAYPSLSNPVTSYLAADPKDSNAEGRMKAAIESIGLDAAFAAIFMGGIKVLRYAKSGDLKAAEAAQVKLQADMKVQQEAKATVATPLAPTAPAVGTAAADVKPGDLRAKMMQGPDGKPSADGQPKAQPKAKTMAEDVGMTGNESISQATISQSPPPELIAAPKAIKSAIDIPKEDVAKLIDLAQQSVADAQVVLGDTPVGRQPKAPINWTKIAEPDAVGHYVQRMTQEYKSQLDVIKGGDIMSDPEVSRRVNHILNAFGMDAEGVIGALRIQGNTAIDNVAAVDAAFTIGQSIVADAHSLARKIKYGILDEFGGDVAKATAKLTDLMTQGLDTLGQAQSIVSNAGRTVRRQRGEFKISAAAVANARGKLGDANFIDALYHSEGDLTKMMKLGNESWVTKMAAKIGSTGQALLINGPLWWWPTHVVNLVSNVVMLGWRPMEKMIGAGIMMPFNGAASRELMKKATKELQYSFSSTSDALSAALDTFLMGDSVMSPHDINNVYQGAHAAGNALPIKPFNSVENIAHNALVFANPGNLIGMPTRVLGASDEFIKTIRYRAVVQSNAAMEARTIGHKGQDALDYIKSRMEASYGPDGEAIDSAALREAQVTTFSQNLGQGTLGKTLSSAVSAHPYLLRPVFTYVRTPVNAFRYNIKMTPGLNLFQTEFRNAIMGKQGLEAQAHAVGQMAMGSLLVTYALDLAHSGMITGTGPKDPKLQAELKAQGWKPYSLIYDNKDGSKSYLPLGRLEPMGMIFGMAADLTDISQHPERADVSKNMGGALMVAVTQNVMNKTFLQSVNQTVKALQDPERSFGNKLGSVLSAMIPASSLLRGTNPDPYLRDARSLLDDVLYQMPGYSDTLAPKRDVFGKAVVAQRGLWTNSKPDPVEEELARIMLDTGKGFSAPSPTRNSVDLRDLKTADGKNVFDELQVLSGQPSPNMPDLKSALAKVMKLPIYKAAVDGDPADAGSKSNLLAAVIQNYRDAAFQIILVKNPDVRKAVNQRKLDTASATRENLRKISAEKNAKAEASGNPLGALAKQLGIQP
jgi:hypothetical protein